MSRYLGYAEHVGPKFKLQRSWMGTTLVRTCLRAPDEDIKHFQQPGVSLKVLLQSPTPQQCSVWSVLESRTHGTTQQVLRLIRVVTCGSCWLLSAAVPHRCFWGKRSPPAYPLCVGGRVSFLSFGTITEAAARNVQSSVCVLQACALICSGLSPGVDWPGSWSTCLLGFGRCCQALGRGAAPACPPAGSWVRVPAAPHSTHAL